MTDLEGCQLTSVPKFSLGSAAPARQPLMRRVKRVLAAPWNQYVKKWLKRAYYAWSEWRGPTEAQITAKEFAQDTSFKTGDWVRVRSREEIAATLDPFNELKGCAFLESMYQFCGTQQRVFKTMQRFLDERDYKVKKVRGVILLDNVICQGTPAFGTCDRSCFLFWREEWLEKIT